MEISETQYQQIEHCMPRQRGNVSHKFSMLFCMLPNMAANDADYPNASVTGTLSIPRMNRWAKSGVLQKVFEQLQQ
ncbi:MAG: hypothetical protein JST74_14365 [Bacteroidetes bacterium]|nr:hypothetical protein [Bacteroidota bacterium]